MAYSIDRYNSSGSSAIIVDDGTINTTLDLKLIGKNYAGYGEAQNENFVWLLENFASRTAPPSAIIGQLWYDSSLGKLKVNYGAGAWRTVAVNNIVEDGVSPPGLTVGDFWWNSVTERLYCRSTSNRDIYIGGQVINANTQLKTTSLPDDVGNLHTVIEAIVNNVITFIISEIEFNLDTTALSDDEATALNGFALIHKGITLSGLDAETSTITDNYKFNGTASNSDKLAGTPASDYITVVSPVFPNAANFSDDGFTVGPGQILEIYNESEVPTIKNRKSETIVFQTTNSVTLETNTALTLNGADIFPGTNDVTNLGGIDNQFLNMYAASFEGALNGHATNATTEADFADSIPVRTSTVTTWDTTTLAPDGVTIVPISFEIAAGSIYATEFAGKAYLGVNADLAEKYLADDTYDVGTVLIIGGDAEVTAAQSGHRAIGVVSANPAYIMNVGLANGTIVALKGRVPVKTTGAIKKGDRLIATDTGLAKSLTSECASLVFAIALNDSDNTEGNTIEALIL